jgi:MFS family permease
MLLFPSVENIFLGRRRTLSLMLLCQAISISLCAVTFYPPVFIMFASISLLFGIAAVILMFTYTSETYETQLRASGVAFNVIYLRMGGAVAPLLAIALAEVSLITPIIFA